MQEKKGEWGYLTRRKRKIVICILILVLMAATIYITGFVLNKMSNRNVFTMIAVLFALPVAKQLVALILLFPYHSVSRERYQKVSDQLPDGMQLMTDLVITSSEQVMHLDFLAVGQNRVIALLGEGKQKPAEVRAYLSKGVHNWGDGYQVKVIDSEKIFLRELQRVTPEKTDPEEEEKVKSYLYSLIV